MSIIKVKSNVYALYDNLVGCIACGTKNEMQHLLKQILTAGTELRCGGKLC